MSLVARALSILLAATTLAGVLAPTTARADVVCDEVTRMCTIEDGGGGGSGGGGGGGEPPKVPLCSSFPPEAVPEDPLEPDWVFIECRLSSTEEDTIGLWVPPRESAEQLAWLLIARLQLKPVEIGLTPLDPDVMTAVGIPVWLWVDNPSRTSWGPALISAGGISLTAKVTSVTWTMGDGTSLRCGRGTEWRPSMVDRDGMVGESPTCGHVYQQQGRYSVRAVAHWAAEWQGYGESGTIRLDVGSTRLLRVGEIQVIVTRGGR